MKTAFLACQGVVASRSARRGGGKMRFTHLFDDDLERKGLTPFLRGRVGLTPENFNKIFPNIWLKHAV